MDISFWESGDLSVKYNFDQREKPDWFKKLNIKHTITQENVSTTIRVDFDKNLLVVEPIHVRYSWHSFKKENLDLVRNTIENMAKLIDGKPVSIKPFYHKDHTQEFTDQANELLLSFNVQQIKLTRAHETHLKTDQFLSDKLCVIETLTLDYYGFNGISFSNNFPLLMLKAKKIIFEGSDTPSITDLRHLHKSDQIHSVGFCKWKLPVRYDRGFRTEFEKEDVNEKITHLTVHNAFMIEGRDENVNHKCNMFPNLQVLTITKIIDLETLDKLASIYSAINKPNIFVRMSVSDEQELRKTIKNTIKYDVFDVLFVNGSCLIGSDKILLTDIL
jgi:hypothetical protein